MFGVNECCGISSRGISVVRVPRIIIDCRVVCLWHFVDACRWRGLRWRRLLLLSLGGVGGLLGELEDGGTASRLWGLREGYVELVLVSAVGIVTLALLEESEAQRFLAEISNLLAFSHQRLSVSVLGNDVGVLEVGAPRWGAICPGASVVSELRVQTPSSPASAAASSASAAATTPSGCVGSWRRRGSLVAVFLEEPDNLVQLVATVEVECLEGGLVIVTAVGVGSEASLEVRDDIDGLDVLGAHLGVDVVGELYQLSGVVVDVLMVEDVPCPEVRQESRPVEVGVWRKFLH